MDVLHDPDTLRDRQDLEFLTETQSLPAGEFQAAQDQIQSHAVVGITNTEGEVLLMDDGEHGWTLTAFPVESDDEWTAVARLGIERVTGRSLSLEEIVRVRAVEFVQEGPGGDRQFSMYTVVFRCSQVDGQPIAEEFQGTNDGDSWRLEWFDAVPASVEGGLADDIGLFVDRI